MSMTLAESMAMAVIRGDRVAAYALADALIEEMREGKTMEAMAANQHRETAALSFHVYRWPEFQAFATRLGFAWDLRTMDIVIRMPNDGLVTIEQQYQGADRTVSYERETLPPEEDSREDE